MTVSIFRSRLAFQQVPSDHPSVIALTARNPVVDPVVRQAMTDFCGADPLEGQQVLISMVDGDEHNFVTRNERTGQLATFGINVAEESFGASSWSDIESNIKLFGFSDDIKALMGAMSDAPWVE